MNWYYASGGQQIGPVEEWKLQELARAGVVTADTLVWREGMAGWKPYSEAVSGAPPLTRYGGFWIRFVARVIDGIILGVVGLLIRIPAFVIMGGATLTLGDNLSPAQALAALPALLAGAAFMLFVSMAINGAYEAYFLSTRGATPGKMALGLKVVRADGGPITVGLAIGRYFASILSALTLCVGYIIAAFDSQKRALHDHICATRVVRTS